MRPVRRDLKTLYPVSTEAQLRRYRAAECGFAEHFGELKTHRFFSAPGRAKICGNQTVLQNGRVFAASVDADIIAVAEPSDDSFIAIKSAELPEIKIDINDLEIKEDEKNTPAALVRGIAKGFDKNGHKIGGFKAFVSSAIKSRFELAGREAFEVLIGTVMSHLFNEGLISNVKIAQMASYAETVYYGLHTDMTNQVACSVGGFVAIDFKDYDTPIIEPVPCDFKEFEHALCIVDTGTEPRNFTEDHEAIDREMKAVASFFDCETLRSLAHEDIMLNIGDLRARFGDRAVLRAIHFFAENDRVERMTHAIAHGSFDDFLHSVKESGNSSFKYLQNVWPVSEVRRQNLSIALNIAETALSRKGACRIHGGGFSGTVEAFVPLEALEQFKMDMEKVFGVSSCKVLTVRSTGGCEVLIND